MLTMHRHCSYHFRSNGTDYLCHEYNGTDYLLATLISYILFLVDCMHGRDELPSSMSGLSDADVLFVSSYSEST
jgi:hypothetical protein